ncbi:hypothetical protein [Pseudoalteromonas piscicida]|uniref:hypothetical protein n=1 Tax=Pseudoalteromonas piscicida TaxID=43662 RepID=UPI001C966108|nr:hypothetical protein [Pseudoalteromonas piscicida]QZO11929.1 hypothetical protein K5642_12510 [Pseudoalteromonas piscicida]
MKRTLIALAIVTIPSTAMALPSLREDCQFSGGTVNTGGADVMFSQNCKTAYVAPPNTGRASLGGHVETQGIEFCSNMDVAKDDYDSSQARAKVWRDKSEALLLEQAPLEDAKIESQVELDTLKAQIDYWQFSALKQSYEINLMEYSNRYSTYSACLNNPMRTRDDCIAEKQGIETAYFEARDAYNNYRAENRTNLYKIDQLTAEIEGLKDQIVAIDDRIIKYDNYADDIEDRSKSNYIELATIYGANTEIVYELDYEAHVDNLRRLNGHIPQITSWRQMPLVAAEFFTNMNPAYMQQADPDDAVLNNLHPIHSVNVAKQLISFQPKGFSNLFESYDGEDKSTEDGAYMNNINPNDVDTLVYGSFGSSSASVAMNLFGACQLKKDNISESELASKMDSYIQTGLRLQWLIEVPFGYEAKYKAHSIISQVSSNKSSGFLFWKKRKSSFYEWSKNSEDFEITFTNAPYSKFWNEDMKETVREAIARRIAFGVLDSVYPRISAAPLNDDEHQRWSDGAKQIGCSFGPYGCAIGWIVGTLDNRRNYSRFYSDKSRFYTEKSTEITYMPKDKYLTFVAQ